MAMNRPLPAPMRRDRILARRRGALRMPKFGAPFDSDASGEAPSARLALASIVGFWLVYFLLATGRMALTDLPAQAEMLPRRLLVTVVAMGLTAILWRVLDRLRGMPTGRLLGVAFLASIPLALAYGAVGYLAFYAFPIPEHVDILRPNGMPTGWLKVVAASGLEWYFFIATWGVMWVALSYAAKVRAAERRAADYARAAQEAELKALRFQVNPHFLFNTLNSLSSLVMRDRRDEAEAMILNLSTFFRATLTRNAQATIPLADEIRLQRLYLDIEQVRFPERLRFRLLVPRELEDALVPAMILQPLVENAIKYGVSRSQRPVTITIAAGLLADKVLELIVRDDGDCPPTEAEAGCGVGLGNVQARLEASFGDAAECVSGRPSAGGWIVRLTMPYTRA
jgi:two-component sensor histidine kinase